MKISKEARKAVILAVFALILSGCTASQPSAAQPLIICSFSGNNAEETDNNWEPGYVVADPVLPDIDGVITELKMYISIPTSCVMAVYSDLSGEPGELLAQTVVKAAASAGWISAAVNPVTVKAGKKYWLISAGNITGVSCVDEIRDGCLYAEKSWDEVSLPGFPADASGWNWAGYDSRSLIYANICCAE